MIFKPSRFKIGGGSATTGKRFVFLIRRIQMNDQLNRIAEAAKYLKEKVKKMPTLAIIAGTGLSEAMDGFSAKQYVEFQEIPHFPVSTVESHLSRLCFARISKVPVMIMQGRFHLYEGYSALQVTFPIRVMQLLGVQTIIMTNAAGGICDTFQPGDIMAITDHINLTGDNPLRGPNDERLGVRFPDMSCAYAADLVEIARKAASEGNICLQTGVYAGLGGPSLETPAEVRFLKTIGADAVGFSTVLETIAAVHGQMKVLGLSLITNVHDPDHPLATTVEEVLETAKKAEKGFGDLICSVVEQLAGKR